MLTRGGLDRALRGSAERGCLRLSPRSPRATSRPSADAAVGSVSRFEPGLTALRPLRGSHLPATYDHRREPRPYTRGSPGGCDTAPLQQHRPLPSHRQEFLHIHASATHRQESRPPRRSLPPTGASRGRRPLTGAPEGRGMGTPVRSGNRRRRGRDSVHSDEAAAETGDPDALPFTRGSPGGCDTAHMRKRRPDSGRSAGSHSI